MATPTMKQILEHTRQLIATKEAEFKTNLAGGVKTAKGLDTTGAGDDSPKTRGHALEADEAALEPQKKPAITADANANPPNDGKGTTGKAEGKEESNQTDRSNTLEAGDAAPASVSKKPAITADANAKKATDGSAKIANSILEQIHAFRDTQKKAEVAAGKDDPKKPVEAKKEESAEKGASAKKVEAPVKKADEPVAPAAAPVADNKQAAGPQMELTTDVLAKIAAMVLSTEEGAEFVEGVMAKAAGAEAAQETLMFLAQQSELAEKQAAYAQGQADAEALIQQAIYQAGVEAGQKQAGATGEQNLFAKLGQQVADESIESLMAQGGGAGGVPPEAAAAGMPPEGAMAPGAEGGMGGDGEISPEELQAGLAQLVQEGTLQPEEAQAVMEYIAQAEGGGEGAAPAEAGGMPPEAGAAPVEAAPAEEPGESAEGKAGSKKEEPGEKAEGESKKEESKEGASKPAEKAAALLETIRQIRQARKA